MSHKYPEGWTGEVGKERPAASVPQRPRQDNGSVPGDPPIRRTWRPCQMLSQDGELSSHHHHHHHQQLSHHYHPHAARNPPHQRNRQSSVNGLSQNQGQYSGTVPEVVPFNESQESDQRPVQQPRAAVNRYRRRGDPNPRLRAHKPKPANKEILQTLSVAEPREGPADITEEDMTDISPKDQIQGRGSPYQTPVAVVTPTHLSSEAVHLDLQQNFQDIDVVCEDDVKEVKEDEKPEPSLNGGDHQPTTDYSDFSHDNVQSVKDEENPDMDVENQEEIIDDVLDVEAQGFEITDLCSDTESAASLNNDGPLHSPPPLQSPTPPSSPDAPFFPMLDHFSEDANMSPLPDNDLLPEDEEECSESPSEYYPKTYADFYTESHQKSYLQPVKESETNCHLKSFPEPLNASYSEVLREPHIQSCQMTKPYEAQKEPPNELFTTHKQENVQKVSPTKGTHYAPRRSRDRGFHLPHVDSSVGCRLHHYDAQSDGEGGSANHSPIQKSFWNAPRQADTRTKHSSPGQSRSGGTRDEVGPNAEVSGDTISLVIRDIREAIEEVKTKTVRSPYTPDQPVEPIWVMRQEISPTEEVKSLQMMAGNSSPQSFSQSASRSPSHHASLCDPDSCSPLSDESVKVPLSQQHPEHQPQSNNHHHQGRPSQQRDVTKQPHPYMQPKLAHQQQYHQQNQHPPHQSHQVQPSSQQPSVQEIRRSLPPFPTFVDIPGPCDPEDLIDGIIFAATYLGCTNLLSERTPTKSARMEQAQEAMNQVRAAQKQAKNRKKSPDSETPSTAEVDLFMSTQRIKVLNADTQESLMDLPLRTISYIADIGNMVVLMARGKMVRSRSAQESLNNTAEQSSMSNDDRRVYRMICHVFESEDAQLIAQSIGQSFSVAYQEFLRANGIDPEDLSQREYSDLLNTQDMYNDDLIHFSKSENCRDVYIEKQKGELVGVVIVESGWGSILPTVIIASLMHGGPAEKSGRLNIGDQIMTINGTSLVGLPLSTCQSIIKGLKCQCRIKMNIVRCPPVTMVLIRRPDLRYQLGFSVQNGIICSLMRGGIAERGGVRVGHRIIEINSQSVVATPHERIVQILSNAMGEIHMKTMPAAMYRLLTAQEQPVFI
ncbi:amyloid-beta A4 precursor protein-binding family A member 1-like [Nerophis lumbriciformis]|uniref:amyloid-beta A4 precursor protein-binding family A member 1-like n=1 Tax=Nerophis lumbriciformis TaxID=546530 RepID=UPI003BAB641D